MALILARRSAAVIQILPSLGSVGHDHAEGLTGLVRPHEHALAGGVHQLRLELVGQRALGEVLVVVVGHGGDRTQGLAPGSRSGRVRERRHRLAMMAPWTSRAPTTPAAVLREAREFLHARPAAHNLVLHAAPRPCRAARAGPVLDGDRDRRRVEGVALPEPARLRRPPITPHVARGRGRGRRRDRRRGHGPARRHRRRPPPRLASPATGPSGDTSRPSRPEGRASTASASSTSRTACRVDLRSAGADDLDLLAAWIDPVQRGRRPSAGQHRRRRAARVGLGHCRHLGRRRAVLHRRPPPRRPPAPRASRPSTRPTASGPGAMPGPASAR